MTNDDRSNEGRPGDDRAPEWRAAAPAEPRYDDRAEPRYDDRAEPRYGERSDDAAPRYGQQADRHDDRPAPTWGDDRRHDQPSAAPASAGAPAWQAYDERKPAKKPATVGVTAFVLGLVALVLGVVGGYFFGAALADSRAFEQVLESGGSVQPDPSDFSDVMGSPSILIAGVLALVGTVLGIWAIVQGIIAIVAKRGRGWGVLGLVLAVLGPIAFVTVYAIVVTSAANGSGVTP